MKRSTKRFWTIWLAIVLLDSLAFFGTKVVMATASPGCQGCVGRTVASPQRVALTLEADVVFDGMILTHQQTTALRYSARHHYGQVSCSLTYCRFWFRGHGGVYRAQTLNPDPALLARPADTLRAVGFDRRSAQIVSTQFRWHQ